MGWEDGCSQDTVTDGVTRVCGTNYFYLVGGEVGYLTVVSTKLRISKGDDASDAVLLVLGEIFNCAVIDSGTLAAQISQHETPQDMLQ